ncbi:MAG: error-prone DNA polymerase [Gemmatimonadaceae bacterium]|nr:error-prone DNA polymerase [Gemmatimonadaceae bacterium]
MGLSYVELRAHSAFSFGDGSVTPERMVARAAELGYTHLGLTDAADLGGIVRFVAAAKRAGIVPIIGAELNVDGRPAAFLACTEEGYRHLAALVTRARSGVLRTSSDVGRGPRRGRPRVTWQDVVERSAGLYALTGPASGPVASRLVAGDLDGAARVLAEWRAVFGDRLAVEVQWHHAGRVEEALAGALIALAARCRVPWVVCNDPRYVDRRSRLVHDLLTALRAGVDLETAAARGVLHPNDGWQLVAPARMLVQWRGREEGIEASERIAAACTFDAKWVRPPLPGFPVPPGETDDSYLRALVYAGARKRWGGAMTARHEQQLEHELDVIRRLGFAGFFLVMWDAVREAHGRGILAQGRGSAANSAVAYCLEITAVDPVRHGLLFERFLSDIRIDGQTEAPDIDVDFEHDRREEMLDYVYDRYARANAAITCVVQTYHAPNAVQDAMRALGYPPELALRISKRVHGLAPAAGAAAMRDGLARACGLALDDARGRTLLAALRGFDDLPRLRSTHPGGFVLSSRPLGDYAPIEPTTMGRTIVQFDKDDLDAVGIPKFDFLGLGALSHVRRAFDLIEQRTGARPELYALDYEDRETYALIARGDTIGTFQIESRAQISSIVHTRPERLYDIVVQVALVRPGPIQARFVHPYTRRRRGQEPVTYLHPELQPILERTQGIPIFQEQAMAIAMQLGKYTAAEADALRRTMGNDRKRDRLLAALEQLRGRMTTHGVPDDVATQIAKDLQSFANYGFPESHAWSFALIAFATAFLKVHYPTEFYAGLMNAWPMGFYPLSTIVHDARRHGVVVHRPCLQHGDWECTVEPIPGAPHPALRVGWRHVRGIGEAVIDRLRACRDAAPFTGIDDVVRRAALTRAEASALARAGAFSVWEPDRRRAAWEALRAAGDTLPLAPARRTLHAPAPMTRDAEIALDYAALGLSVIGHPMERWRAWCRTAGALDSATLLECRDGERVIVAGLVTVRQRPQSAKGTVFVLLEDELGTINVIVSRRQMEVHGEIVRHATFLAVYGRVEWDGTLINVIGEKFKALESEDGNVLAHRSHDFH